MMRRLVTLGRDARGVTAVEFALVAPVFLMFMMLILDGGRAVWTYQTLQEVATSSARCAALGITGCKTSTEVQTYAVDRAAASGIKLVSTAVTLTPSTSCQSVAGMTKVAISSSFLGATTKLLPSPISALNTESCFPTATS